MMVSIKTRAGVSTTVPLPYAITQSDLVAWLGNLVNVAWAGADTDVDLWFDTFTDGTWRGDEPGSLELTTEEVATLLWAELQIAKAAANA